MYSLNFSDRHRPTFLFPYPFIIPNLVNTPSLPWSEGVVACGIYIYSFYWQVGEFRGFQFWNSWCYVSFPSQNNITSNSPFLLYYLAGGYVVSLNISWVLGMFPHFFLVNAGIFCPLFWFIKSYICSIWSHNFVIFYFCPNWGRFPPLFFLNNHIYLSLNFHDWFLSEVIAYSPILNNS